MSAVHGSVVVGYGVEPVLPHRAVALDKSVQIQLVQLVIDGCESFLPAAVIVKSSIRKITRLITNSSTV